MFYVVFIVVNRIKGSLKGLLKGPGVQEQSAPEVAMVDSADGRVQAALPWRQFNVAFDGDFVPRVVKRHLFVKKNTFSGIRVRFRKDRQNR